MNPWSPGCNCCVAGGGCWGSCANPTAIRIANSGTVYPIDGTYSLASGIGGGAATFIPPAQNPCETIIGFPISSVILYFAGLYVRNSYAPQVGTGNLGWSAIKYDPYNRLLDPNPSEQGADYPYLYYGGGVTGTSVTRIHYTWTRAISQGCPSGEYQFTYDRTVNEGPAPYPAPGVVPDLYFQV